MSVPLKIDVADAPDAAGVRADVLYGNERFQARLWELSPGAGLNTYPQKGLQESRTLAITPGLVLGGEPLSPGAYRTTTGGSIPGPIPGLHGGQGSCVLKNEAPVAAFLLELVNGERFEPVPLSEITEVRPWGSFTVLKDAPQYKLKQLTVQPGNRLSLQRHQKREEHWLITQGHPEITLDDKILRLGPGDYTHIPLHSWHRIANPDDGEPVEIIELQLGAYFGEDDIERREDDYGRC